MPDETIFYEPKDCENCTEKIEKGSASRFCKACDDAFHLGRKSLKDDIVDAEEVIGIAVDANEQHEFIDDEHAKWILERLQKTIRHLTKK